MKKKNQAIDDELKKLLIDCTYTARGHQVAGQRWAEVNNCLGIPAAICSALAGVGSAASAVTENKWLAAGLALLSVAFAATNDFVRPEEKSNAHLSKGRFYLSLRDEVRLYRDVTLQEDVSFEQVEKSVKSFRSRYSELGKMAPLNIPRWAYEIAKKNIEDGESDYENDPLWERLK